MAQASMPQRSGPPRRLAYVINHAAFFASHRLPLAEAAKARGWDVHLITGLAGSAEMEPAAEFAINAAGIEHRRVSFRSSSVNPVREARGLWQLARELRRITPQVVHCASPKGTIYGGIAARMAGVPAIVVSISGQGYVATNDGRPSLAKRVIAAATRLLYRLAFAQKTKRIVVQNVDDRAAALARGLARNDEIRLISGSGVDLDLFCFQPMAGKEKIVLFPARMLADKGLHEFASAAKVLKGRYPSWRFVLAGTADYQNPTAVPASKINEWVAAGFVEWVGHVEDMPALYARAAIVCLPSYREGMPKVLLEAAASGCAVVTTDAVGCREAILPGVTGELVAVRDAAAVESALERLIVDESLREHYGKAGRALAEQRFSLNQVIDETMAIYDELTLQRDRDVRHDV